MIFKKKEILSYLFFGILTTIVYLITYYLLTFTILNPENTLELQISNIISWITSVSFAYITNKLYVFNSKTKNITKEIISFFTARISTLIIDMILMYIFVTKLNYNDKIIKLLVTIIIIIINYILSKLLVFKTKQITSI